MSRFFSICNKNKSDKFSANTNSLKKTRPSSCALSLKMPLLLIITIFLVGFFYVFNITSNSTNGFKISELENKIEDLKLTNQKLKSQVNLLDNPALLKDKADQAGLVLAGQAEYLSLSNMGVAFNK